MEAEKWWNRTEYVPGYVVFAVLSLLVGWYLSWGNGIRTDSLQQAMADNERIRTYEKQSFSIPKRDFLIHAFPASGALDYGSLLEEVGLSVEDVSEEEGNRTSLGQFHKIFISGTGSFAQILRGFDIIQSEERWNAVYLKEMKRTEKGLTFSIEIQTFQCRGTYEEEKYRPDRSHGNREEQSRQDSF